MQKRNKNAELQRHINALKNGAIFRSSGPAGMSDMLTVNGLVCRDLRTSNKFSQFVPTEEDLVKIQNVRHISGTSQNTTVEYYDGQINGHITAIKANSNEDLICDIEPQKKNVMFFENDAPTLDINKLATFENSINVLPDVDPHNTRNQNLKQIKETNKTDESATQDCRSVSNFFDQPHRQAKYVKDQGDESNDKSKEDLAIEADIDIQQNQLKKIDQFGTIKSTDHKVPAKPEESTNLEIKVGSLVNRPKSANAGQRQRPRSFSRILERQQSNKFGSRPTSTVSKYNGSMNSLIQNNNSLEPILIKLWILITNGKKIYTDDQSDSMDGLTAANSKSEGRQKSTCNKQLLSGDSKLQEKANPINFSLKAKEYFRLIITIQLGLFLANDKQMPKSNQSTKQFRKKWESMTKRNTKTFSFGDFKNDMGQIINESLYQVENISDEINSDLRKVIHYISGNDQQIVCLKDLQEIFKLKSDRDNAEAEKNDDGTKQYQIKKESENFEKYLNQLSALYRYNCNSQEAYQELINGFAKIEQPVKNNKKQVSKQKRISSATTRNNNWRRSSINKSSNKSLVVSQTKYGKIPRPVQTGGPRPFLRTVTSNKSELITPSTLHDKDEDILSQIERAQNPNDMNEIQVKKEQKKLQYVKSNNRNTATFLHFAFDIDNTKQLYHKNGKHKLQESSNKQRPKSAVQKKKPNTDLKQVESVPTEREKQQLGTNIMNGIFYKQQISRKKIQIPAQTEDNTVQIDMFGDKFADQFFTESCSTIQEVTMARPPMQPTCIGTGTDVQQSQIQSIARKMRPHRQYHGLNKIKAKEGRAGLMSGQLIGPPPLANTIQLRSRQGTILKNKMESAKIIGQKTQKREEWGHQFSKEIKEYQNYKLNEIVPEIKSQKTRNSMRYQTTEIHKMQNPKLFKYEKNECTPNYIQEYFQNQNLFPNPSNIEQDGIPQLGVHGLRVSKRDKSKWSNTGYVTMGHFENTALHGSYTDNYV